MYSGWWHVREMKACRIELTAATFEGAMEISSKASFERWASTRWTPWLTCDFEALNPVYVQAFVNNTALLSLSHGAGPKLIN
jgi:hypothetical protein